MTTDTARQLRKSAEMMARGINSPAIGSDPSHYLEGQAADLIERYEAALSWIEDQEPQIVVWARDKFRLASS